MADKTIRRWECPVHGYQDGEQCVYGEQHPDCELELIERTYVVVDATEAESRAMADRTIIRESYESEPLDVVDILWGLDRVRRYVAIDASLSPKAIQRAQVAQGRMAAGPNANTGEERDEETAIFYAIPEDQMRAAIEAALTGEQHVAYTEPLPDRQYRVACETCDWTGGTYIHIEDARDEGRAHEAAASGKRS